MKDLLRGVFSSKILCFVLHGLEFIVVVVAWAFIEFRFVCSILRIFRVLF